MQIKTPSSKLIFSPNDEYVLDEQNDIYRFVTLEIAQQLSEYLPAFESYRKQLDNSNIQPEEYEGLPHNRTEKMWQERSNDLAFILNLIKPGAEVLEIGSWNGWLTHHLAKKNSVTACDYFIHEKDGLGARRFYANANWTSIQMDPHSIALAECTFDHILFNRSVIYYERVPELLEICKKKVNPGGSMIITGLSFCKNPLPHLQNYEEVAHVFEQQYGISFYLTQPYRKVLSFEDRELFHKSGFDLVRQTPLLNSIKNRLLTTEKAVVYHAVWKRPLI